MPITNSIDYSTFFWFDDPLANRPLRLRPQPDLLDGWEKGYSLFTGKWVPKTPLTFKAYVGGSVTDILWGGSIDLICISEKTVNLLLDNHFTGWATYPVEVYDRKGGCLPGYHGFSVKSYAGVIDISNSQVIDKSPMVPNGPPWKAYKGICFDEKMWDGSDIFRVSGMIVVTRKVELAFNHAKITNVQFIPLTEVEMDVSDFKDRNNK